jgi:hypothetical protein
VKVFLKEKVGPWSRTGEAWVAYHEVDGFMYSLYIGCETREATEQRVKEEFSHKTVEFEMFP